MAIMYVCMCVCHVVNSLRDELSLLSVWKNALEMFVHNKSMISKKHEFAVVILKDSAQWVSQGMLATSTVGEPVDAGHQHSC